MVEVVDILWAERTGLLLQFEAVDDITIACRRIIADGTEQALFNISVICIKLNICGPVITGNRHNAGSKTLCPPCSTRLPPTMAISAAPISNSISPMVSPMITSVWAG